MYNPKIKEELITKIYHVAKSKRMKMTTLVNEILSKGLDEMENSQTTGEELEPQKVKV